MYSVFPDFEAKANKLMLQQVGASMVHAVAITLILIVIRRDFMKVAIAGAGIAGGYLARLLEQEEFRRISTMAVDHETSCGCRSCGWGAPAGIGTYLADVGLDLNEYLIEPMPSMNFDGLVAKTPLCTIHKPRLLRDLTSGTRLKTAEPGDRRRQKTTM